MFVVIKHKFEYKKTQLIDRRNQIFTHYCQTYLMVYSHGHNALGAGGLTND